MSRHSERCKLCKTRIQEFLQIAYGRVEPNRKLDLPAKVADLPPSPHSEVLTSIYKALQRSRGHTGFPRRPQLPHVDFFLPDQKMIVEVDESQHFTAQRDLALSLYPEQLRLGFQREGVLRQQHFDGQQYHDVVCFGLLANEWHHAI